VEYTFGFCLEFLRKCPKILEQGKEQTGQESFYKRRSIMR
jgi:hypothetical protein